MIGFAIALRSSWTKIQEERDTEKADDPAAHVVVLDQDDQVTDGGLSYSLP